jgi:hypothetical protein
MNPEKHDPPSKPSGREIFGVSALAAGIILILVAIIILMFVFLKEKKACVAKEATPANFAGIAKPALAPAPVNASPAQNSVATVVNKSEKPASFATSVTKADKIAEAETSPVVSRNESPVAKDVTSDAGEKPPSTEAVDLPPLVVGGPRADVSEYVQSIRICGEGTGRILLLMPGQDEARAYRNGDMLDSNLELVLQKIEAQRLVIVDAAGNKYFKAF